MDSVAGSELNVFAACGMAQNAGVVPNTPVAMSSHPRRTSAPLRPMSQRLTDRRTLHRLHHHGTAHLKGFQV